MALLVMGCGEFRLVNIPPSATLSYPLKVAKEITAQREDEEFPNGERERERERVAP